MAKCEKREIRPVAPPVEYVLTLTEDEAMAVCLALGDFGGYPDPVQAPFDALYDALGNNSDYLNRYEIVSESGRVRTIRQKVRS